MSDVKNLVDMANREIRTLRQLYGNSTELKPFASFCCRQAHEALEMGSHRKSDPLHKRFPPEEGTQLERKDAHGPPCLHAPSQDLARTLKDQQSGSRSLGASRLNFSLRKLYGNSTARMGLQV